MRLAVIGDDRSQLVQEVTIEHRVRGDPRGQPRAPLVDSQGDVFLAGEQLLELRQAGRVKRDRGHRRAGNAGGPAQLRKPSLVDERDVDPFRWNIWLRAS